MESLLIKGGVPLHGEVTISGAKNAVLPIMAAALLTDEPCVIRRVPNLSDVKFMAQILEWLGATVKIKGDTVHIHAKKIKGSGDYELVRKMRGSICIMGPLLGRLKKAIVSLPGGCVIGARPINLHLKGFEALGAKIRIENGYVEASAKHLLGTAMFLGGRAGSTVLGTGNVMMAATLADGVTIIESAACEPEVVDLANFLNAMGTENLRRRQPCDYNYRRQETARRGARSDSGSRRSRHLRDCCRRDEWRGHPPRRARRPPARGARQVARCGSES